MIVSPHGGFGNRIRVLCSACHYAELYTCQLEHLWDGGPFICSYPHIQQVHNRGFSYFFQPKLSQHLSSSEHPELCYSEWTPSVNGWWKHQNYGQTRLKCAIVKPLHTLPMPPTNSFLIETTLRILPMTPAESHRIYSLYFTPQERFTCQVPILPESTIGISVRRSEFLHFFPEANVGLEVLHTWLSSFTQPIVLFSEDKAFLRNARTLLVNPVTCTFESYEHVPEDRAFLEFLTLAKCSHIYGTLKSSFAEEAAFFGNIPYTPITPHILVSTSL